METHDDTQEQLNDLEEEEARIMRELRALDERAAADQQGKQRQRHPVREDPKTVLSSLLLECEKEVRDAKGFIAEHGPPLVIVRVRSGESAPKGATYLSRPKNTGVDFTVPLTSKDYTSVIKRPMFLNIIRDKIKAKAYPSSEDYLEDMRLLTRNTAQFNKGAELAWVVQHARLLLEAAEDSVVLRRKALYEVEDALRNASLSKNKGGAGSSVVGKRKRASSAAGSASHELNGDSSLPAVGQAIDVYWQNYRRWFSASVVGITGTNVHVVYDEDNTDQWIDLHLKSNVKWRVRNARAAASTKTRRVQEPPSQKRRKATASSSVLVDTAAAPVHMPSGPSNDEFDALKDHLLSKTDDLKIAISDQIKEHLDRVDKIIGRSDHLDRVLLAVADSGERIEGFMRRIEARQLRIEEKVAKLLGYGHPSSYKDAADKYISSKGASGIVEIPADEEQVGKVCTDCPRKGGSEKVLVVDEVIEIEDTPAKMPEKVISKDARRDDSEPAKEKGQVQPSLRNTRDERHEDLDPSGQDLEMKDVEKDNENEMAEVVQDSEKGKPEDDKNSEGGEDVTEPQKDRVGGVQETSKEDGEEEKTTNKAAEKEERQGPEDGAKEKDQENQADNDKDSEALRSPESPSQDDNENASKVVPEREEKDKVSTHQAGKTVVVKQEKSGEGLRGVIGDGNGSSEDSDDSDDSDSDSSSDGDEPKAEKKSDNIQNKAAQKTVAKPPSAGNRLAEGAREPRSAHDGEKEKEMAAENSAAEDSDNGESDAEGDIGGNERPREGGEKSPASKMQSRSKSVEKGS